MTVCEVCRRRGSAVRVRVRVRILNGEEGLESEVHLDGIRLQHVSLRCVLKETGTECSRKVASGMGVAGAIRSLVNPRDLQFECARVLDETLLVPVLMHRNDAML